MTETHVISALKAKRAEISGYIKDLERHVRQQRANMAHIDASIRLFAPGSNPDSIPPRRRYRRAQYFSAGELPRLCMDVLRDGQPITALALADRLIADKNLPVGDDNMRRDIGDRVLNVLRRLQKRGAITKTGISRDAIWGLSTLA